MITISLIVVTGWYSWFWWTFRVQTLSAKGCWTSNNNGANSDAPNIVVTVEDSFDVDSSDFGTLE